jgi:hypothetical protein
MLAKSPRTAAYGKAFELSSNELKYTRFFISEKVADAPKTYERKGDFGDSASVAVKEWNVWNYDTIWTPRKKWADSKDFHDSEELMRQALESDWLLCLDSHKTAHVIARADTLEPPACIDACFDVLWESVSFVYGTFDYYSTLGASDDIFHLKLNSYKTILEDCHLFEEGSKTCSLTAFDQNYIAVTAGGKGPTARFLNRQQWLQCLVRFAIMRHVATGRLSTVAEALRRLINYEMLPRVDKRCLVNTYQFREECCYLRDTVDILTSFESNLRIIYAHYARGSGAIGNELDSNKLLSFEEWKEFVRDTELVDRDFTSREVAISFAWSRMRVVNTDVFASKIKMLQLSFEDFLEALVRVAALKALPNDEEIYDYECEDAGDFILKLRGSDPVGWNAFLDRRMRPWGTELSQPIYRLVEGLCELIFRTVAQWIASGGDERKSVKDMDNLTFDNITVFRKLVQKKRSKG